MLWRRRRRPRDRAAEKPPITPAMTHREIEEAGGMVDVPYSSLPVTTERPEYADLGEVKRWTPADGFTIAGIPYADVVAGIGRGTASRPTGSDDNGAEEGDVAQTAG